MGYKGPPTFGDVPIHGRALSIEQLQSGDVLADEIDEDDVELDGPIGVGFARPEYNARFPEMCESGTQGLKPFPGCQGPEHDTPEDYPERYPNIEVVQRGGRAFSQWGDFAAGTAGNELAVATPTRWKTYRFAKSPPVPGGGSCLWQIDLWAHELVRIVNAVDGPVTPSQNTVTQDGGGASPSVLVGNQSSKCKMRLMWAASSGGTTRVIDIAQGIRLALEASLVTVEFLYPDPGTVNLKLQGNSAPPPLAPNGGTVLDTAFGVCIVPTTSTPGQQLCTNTMTVAVLAGEADLPVFVPPGTRRVTVLQGPVGALATPSWRHARDRITPGPIVAPIAIGANRQATSERPGHSGLITTGPADGVFDRLLTFIFELEI